MRTKPAPRPIVSLENVTKRFGDTLAIDNLSFDVFDGNIFGFIGPNGAGKTTTLKLIATLLRPDAGQLRVVGNSTVSQPRAVRRTIGYMPDFLGVYHGLTTEEYLDFFGATYRIKPGIRKKLIDDLLALTDLIEKRNVLVTSLSRGMQQRLGLARALIHDPRVLLLDEPASGLDPRARVEIRELLRELARMGKTIILSSHILADLEEICSHIALLDRGRVVFDGDRDELLATGLRRVAVRIEHLGRQEHVLGLLGSIDDVEVIASDGAQELTVEAPAAPEFASRLLERLVLGGVPVVSYSRQLDSLEQIYLRLTASVEES